MSKHAAWFWLLLGLLFTYGSYTEPTDDIAMGFTTLAVVSYATATVLFEVSDD